jgi:hypothetical protein
VKFWRENRIDSEFDMEPAAVAEAFRKAVLADEHDLKHKWLGWTHARALLDWMTGSYGLNATWEDRNGFGEICDIVWADPELRAI